MTLPNIVYIHSHDTGRYIQPFGYKTFTPNLQRLAQEGILFRQPPAPIPDTPATRQDMAGFNASIRVMDKGVGMVLDALKRNDLVENTLVISTTDRQMNLHLSLPSA